jgi:hypothetical protein
MGVDPGDGLASIPATGWRRTPPLRGILDP